VRLAPPPPNRRGHFHLKWGARMREPRRNGGALTMGHGEASDQRRGTPSAEVVRYAPAVSLTCLRLSLILPIVWIQRAENRTA
jgi:hypothetical protein